MINLFKNILLVIPLMFITCDGGKPVIETEEEIRYEEIISEISRDMKLPHEAPPHGIPTYYSWKYVPTMGRGNTLPPGWEAIIAWGQLFVDETQDNSEDPAPNTRVALKDLRILLLDKSGHWSELGNFPIVGGLYEEDFSLNINKDADIRQESDGSISTKAGQGYNFHFYWDRRIAIDGDNIMGLIAVVSGKLILDDPSKPDDRANSKYILGSGADYWRDFTSVWAPEEGNNAAVALGRLKRVGNEWRKYYMHTLTEDTFKNYPIPLQLLEQ